MTKAGKLGICLAVSHFAAVVATITWLHFNDDGQGVLVWIYWQVPDFPVGLAIIPLLHFDPAWLENLFPDNPFLASVVTDQFHFVHGILGTLWWGFLPRVFMSKRSGGLFRA